MGLLTGAPTNERAIKHRIDNRSANQLPAPAESTSMGSRPDDLRVLGFAWVVAVGTALSGRPPHRSQRAGLPHWAPTSGSDAQTLLWIGMQNPGTW